MRKRYKIIMVDDICASANSLWYENFGSGAIVHDAAELMKHCVFRISI